jgi:hypothetical protein
MFGTFTFQSLARFSQRFSRITWQTALTPMGSGRGFYLSISPWLLRLYPMMMGNLFRYAIASLDFIAKSTNSQKWNIAYPVLPSSDTSNLQST